MIKICGVVLMFLGSFAYSETTDLWFAQAGLMGVFFVFSEGLFDFAIAVNNRTSLDKANVDHEPVFAR